MTADQEKRDRARELVNAIERIEWLYQYVGISPREVKESDTALKELKELVAEGVITWDEVEVIAGQYAAQHPNPYEPF